MSEDYRYYFEREDNKELVSLSYKELVDERDWEHNGKGRTFIICDDEIKAFELDDDKERKLNNKGFVNIGFQENPRWSWAMAVNVEDIPKMQKQYPDRVYNLNTGQLLVKNRTEKKRLMKEHNMEEH
jgi:hypothetical protein